MNDLINRAKVRLDEVEPNLFRVARKHKVDDQDAHERFTARRLMLDHQQTAEATARLILGEVTA